MRTLIYISLIAIIVLTGCKSNSFLTQRYTKFGHNSHKNSHHEKEIVKATSITPETTIETEVVKRSETPITLVTSAFSSLKETILKHDPKGSNLKANTNLSSNSLSKNKNTGIENSKEEPEKSGSKKAKGCFLGAFSTAAYIVLVIIFILLILFVISLFI